MATLREQVNMLIGLGYKRLAAQAKVAHDVVLLAMHKSGFKTKSTIKGGVVMSSITRDIVCCGMGLSLVAPRMSLTCIICHLDLTGMYCEHTWHRLSMQIIAVRSVRRKKLSTRCSARFLLNGIWLNLALPASTGLVCRRRSQQV